MWMYELVLTLAVLVSAAIGSPTQQAEEWTAPPARQPSALLAVAGDGKVYLQWNPNLEEDLVGYRVYRRQAGMHTFKSIHTQPIAGAKYVDRQAPNGTAMEYVVTAVLKSGLESDGSNLAAARPRVTTAPIVSEEPSMITVPGQGALRVANGIRVQFENGHRLVFDKDLVRVRDWQTESGVHLLYPHSYGNPVDITEMNRLGFSEAQPATLESPAIPPRINLNYNDPNRARKLAPRYLEHVVQDNRITFCYQIPLSGPGVPQGSNWDLWLWANLWETWSPITKTIGGIQYSGLVRTIELELPSYYDEEYSICLNDGFGLHGSCDGAITLELTWGETHLVETRWQSDKHMQGLGGKIRESRRFHPDGHSMQTLPFIFAHYPSGTLLLAPRHYYYAATYALRNYVGQGQDALWRNLKIDCATAGERFTVESFEYLWTSDQSLAYPQKYMDASFHYRRKLADLYQVNPYVTAMAHAWDYHGPSREELEGKAMEEACEILRRWAKERAKQAERLGADLLGGAHRLWTGAPEATPDEIRLDPHHPINEAIADVAAILKEYDIGLSYWTRPEFTRSALPNVLSHRFIAEVGQYRGCTYPALKQILEAVGMPLVREHPEWIRTGRDGDHPLLTPYHWVPMSLTQGGWYDEVVYKALVMMKELGYTSPFQDGVFGCMAGIDYTDGRARPVQPYYWRYFADVHRLGMSINGECLIGWGNNTVGYLHRKDMKHLWAYTHGIHRGNRAGDAIHWFTPEMQHRSHQLYIGVYLNLDSDPEHGDVARFVRRFLEENGHPARVCLVGLRWSKPDKQWIWDEVWWEYEDGRRVLYPDYSEIAK